MAGAWEIPQQSVLAAVLHTDNTTVAWSFGLRNLQIPGPVIGLAGMPYDMARNQACMRCLEGGFDWIWFLDSDVIPPPDAVLRLMRHQQPVISGMYCRRSPPAGVPVMIKDGVGWVTNFKKGSVIEVDLVGAGCLLIHRSVLERLPPSRPGYHWFDWRVNMNGVPGNTEPCLSEDFQFCYNVRTKLGIKILVDTSIQCKHVGYSEATYGSLQPLDTMALPV